MRRGVLLSLLLGASILAASVAAPAQRRRGRTRTAAAPIVVRPVDLAGFKQLLHLDQKSNPEKAKPLLVNFWATWCDPCREEFPDLVKIDNDYRSQGLDFVAISLDDLPDIKTAVPKFLREMQATMPTYLLNVSDPEPAILSVDKSWTGALPATFLYDADGKVVFHQFGRITTSELRAAIEKLVGSKH
ncbi:MAG: redoxin [Acidobacteria bacterium]|nr:redoxin [Acidobacteriota bacterium]